MRIAIVLTTLSLVLFAAGVGSQESSHHEAALRFHQLSASGDATQAANIMASAFLSQNPEFAAQKQIVVDWLLELVRSTEYEEVKVQVYMTVYTKEELDQLIALVQLPAFKLMLQQQPTVLRLSTQPLMALAQANYPELERRIQESQGQPSR